MKATVEQNNFHKDNWSFLNTTVEETAAYLKGELHSMEILKISIGEKKWYLAKSCFETTDEFAERLKNYNDTNS